MVCVDYLFGHPRPRGGASEERGWKDPGVCVLGVVQYRRCCACVCWVIMLHISTSMHVATYVLLCQIYHVVGQPCACLYGCDPTRSSSRQVLFDWCRQHTSPFCSSTTSSKQISTTCTLFEPTTAKSIRQINHAGFKKTKLVPWTVSVFVEPFKQQTGIGAVFHNSMSTSCYKPEIVLCNATNVV